MNVNKKSVLFILIGLATGAVFGTSFGPVVSNIVLATALGAVGGLFVGWFIAAAVREQEKKKLS